MNPQDITALILTRDEERNLPRAMTSLPHGVSVFVLDAYSNDGTVAYARGAGAIVEQREWTDFVDARRYAIERVRTPWLLMLDADEALDDRLRDAILDAGGDANGYIVRRRTYFRGKPMRMWDNEPLLRLVKTGHARIEARPATGGDAAVHERLLGDGSSFELDGTLLHYSYDDARSYREKYERYTAIEAATRSGSFAAFAGSVALAPLRFASNLFRRGALLDGPRGWYVAWYSALYPAVVQWKALRGKALRA